VTGDKPGHLSLWSLRRLRDPALRWLRPKILRAHATRIESAHYIACIGGRSDRAARLLRHWANGIESGRLP